MLDRHRKELEGREAVSQGGGQTAFGSWEARDSPPVGQGVPGPFLRQPNAISFCEGPEEWLGLLM